MFILRWIDDIISAYSWLMDLIGFAVSDVNISLDYLLDVHIAMNRYN